ncbi:hypothetical protein [Streptomyces sp. NPDC021622]|uniref:hypothetical protein n=1 Tax=Streptomyces sp. NPDC021622 TaxID=3155013 RepID=UPI00340F7C2E
MSVAIYRRLAAEDHAEYGRALEEAVETQELVRSAGSGGPVAPTARWTSEEHWVNLLNQDEVWQDVQDRRHRLDEMPRPTVATSCASSVNRPTSSSSCSPTGST